MLNSEVTAETLQKSCWKIDTQQNLLLTNKTSKRTWRVVRALRYLFNNTCKQNKIKCTREIISRALCSCNCELSILLPWRPMVQNVLSALRPAALPFIYLYTYSNLFKDMHILYHCVAKICGCILMQESWNLILY